MNNNKKNKNNKYYLILSLLLLMPKCALSLNLIEVINHVIKTHPNILANEASLDVNEYKFYETINEYLPKINISRTQTREQTRTPSIDTIILNAHTNKIELKQNLFAGFQNVFNSKSSLWNYYAAKEIATNDINTTILESISIYVDVLKNDKILNLAKKNYAFYNKNLQQLKRLYESGATDKADYLLVKTHVQNSKRILDKSQKDYDSAIAKFTHFIDLKPINLTAVKSVSSYLNHNLNELINDSITNNPLIKENKSKLQALNYDLKNHKSVMLPNLDLNISKSIANNVDGVSGSRKDISIGLTGSLNLFDGGKNYLAIKRKESEKNKVMLDLDNQLRTTKEVANELWLTLESLKQKKLAINEQIVAAEQSLHSYLTLFEYNQAYLLNVLNAKRLLFNAQTENITNSQDKLITEYRILLLGNKLMPVINQVYN